MTNTTSTIATVGTRYALRIQTWQFMAIAERAYKYNWEIVREEGEKVYYYNPKTMWVYGRVVGETEKAYKVLVDYSKHVRNSGNFKVAEGFTAYIAKKAIVDLIEEVEDCGDDYGVVDNMPCDFCGFCAGSSCPMFHECHG